MNATSPNSDLAGSPAAGVSTAEEMGPQLLAVERLAGLPSHSHVNHASMELNVKRFRKRLVINQPQPCR
jgi:hypothetical protein